MSWEDRSVTLGNVEKEEFDLELAMVTVTENRIIVDFKEQDDWKRITREVGEDVVLQEVWWEDVESVDVTQDHLYYPHIDISVTPEEEDAEETDVLNEKRLYFIEDETHEFRRVLNTIRRFWNAWRQRNAPAENTYHYQPDEDGAEDEVELEEAIDDNEEDVEAAAAETIGASEEDGETPAPDTAAAEETAPASSSAEAGGGEADAEAGEEGVAKRKLEQVPDDQGGEEMGTEADAAASSDASDDGGSEEKKQGIKDEVEDIVDGFMDEE